MNGILLIDKDTGLTSHKIVQTLRSRFRGTKTGHLGTLDPLATGLLPVMLGKANRLHSYLSQSKKRYHAVIRFGFSTDTYDCTGEPASEKIDIILDKQQVEDALSQFSGKIVQTPPLFSAIKLNGKPLYKYARSGKNPEVKTREVTIYKNDLLKTGKDTIELDILCSPGTYIRSIAHDLGKIIGCGAHLESLRRTGAGSFSIEHAARLEKITSGETDLISSGILLPMEDVLNQFKSSELFDETLISQFFNGIEIDAEGIHITEPTAEMKELYEPEENDYIRVFYNNILIGIGLLAEGKIKPKTVFRI
ncbi:MAG: tRNA pseudouridine(55) synthase TruB [Acidobacteria bacterium]|nr:tRNA pseudouridine(55) synthase TruB [Acidobacteriota bacterium]